MCSFRDILTPRELEVFELYARGYTQEEITRELFIGKKTIQHHAREIMGKLEATGNMRLAIYRGYKQGIIIPPVNNGYQRAVINICRETAEKLEALELLKDIKVA
jgi:DNA-binding CsgD family transcriptional regulator